MGLRVVLISQIQPAVEAYVAGLRAMGHEPVGLLCVRSTSRYGFDLGDHVIAAPPEVDVVMPASRERIAPLLVRSIRISPSAPDSPGSCPSRRSMCRGSVINFHPSLLPRYRGPTPVAWAIRNGETEIGVTFHRMAPDLDTGPILAQATLALGDEWSWDELGPRIGGLVQQILPVALERVERGDPGDPQDESAGEYLSFFEPDYTMIDWSRPAAEIERQVRAWRFGSAGGGEQGALTELDGERVRVLRVSLEGGEGRPVDGGDGTVWVLETEPVGET